MKIAPDLSDEDVLAVADLAIALGLDGIIATNTTIGRTGINTSPDEVDALGAADCQVHLLGNVPWRS